MLGKMVPARQSLLVHSPHNNSTPNCKILFLALSITALIITSAVFLLPNPNPNPLSHHHFYLSNICHNSLNPHACRGFVSEVTSTSAAVQHTPTALLNGMLINQLRGMNAAASAAKNLQNQINDDVPEIETGPLHDCIELFDLATELLVNSIHALENQSFTSHSDAQAWLSGVLTNHVTCSDGLRPVGRKFLRKFLDESISRSRASLAVLAAISPPQNDAAIRVSPEKLPSWITPADRKLLQSSANQVKADLTVAKDGSGNYKTVAEAIAAAPDKLNTRFVIRVKKGTYKENIEVTKNKQNLMIIGDGMDSTIITGSLNVVDGSTTFRSATLAAVGQGFILQDICIQNTAGPEKHQAVALRVGADQSVINRCKIEAYQDTLYAHSLRQFYRDCTISGTVDFIFGNAAVVLQKCKLVVRKPMKSQKNMVTAQGRTDPNENTGTSIQDCEIRTSSDLEPVKADFPTYLGRPWKAYSRTVVMQSYIGDLVVPAGWSVWDGDFALSTLYYGEYMNRGPGAGTGKRVTWAGYHVITSAAEATKFTVKALIQGGQWLGSTGVAYTEGL